MNSEITYKFSKQLKFLCSCKSVENKISMSQIANEIGIEKSSLSKYMNDQAEPGLTTICKIADYFNVSTDFLLGVSRYHSDYEIISFAQKFTGLSFRAIENLSSMDESMKNCINSLLEEYKNDH